MFLSKKRKKNIPINRILLTSILLLYINYSCGNDEKTYVDIPYDRETIPSIIDDSVTMLVSDSGIIKYKMISKEWRIYDRASNPYHYFPQGIYLEQFDTLFNKNITIVADTAWNYTPKKIWRLKGNVFIKNIKNETFKTQEVFFDEKKQKIYSNEYIEINRPDKLNLKGIGFISNTNMTQYKIYKPFDTDIIVDQEMETSKSQPKETN